MKNMIISDNSGNSTEIEVTSYFYSEKYKNDFIMFNVGNKNNLVASVYKHNETLEITGLYGQAMYNSLMEEQNKYIEIDKLKNLITSGKYDKVEEIKVLNDALQALIAEKDKTMKDLEELPDYASAINAELLKDGKLTFYIGSSYTSRDYNNVPYQEEHMEQYQKRVKPNLSILEKEIKQEHEVQKQRVCLYNVLYFKENNRTFILYGVSEKDKDIVSTQVKIVGNFKYNDQLYYVVDKNEVSKVHNNFYFDFVTGFRLYENKEQTEKDYSKEIDRILEERMNNSKLEAKQIIDNLTREEKISINSKLEKLGLYEEMFTIDNTVLAVDCFDEVLKNSQNKAKQLFVKNKENKIIYASLLKRGNIEEINKFKILQDKDLNDYNIEVYNIEILHKHRKTISGCIDITEENYLKYVDDRIGIIRKEYMDLLERSKKGEEVASLLEEKKNLYNEYYRISMMIRTTSRTKEESEEKRK